MKKHLVSAALCFYLIPFFFAFSQQQAPDADKKQRADSLQSQGKAALERAGYKESLSKFEESLKLYEELGDLNGAADCLNYIGQVYRELGDYAKARDYYTRALKIHEKIGDKQGVGSDLNGLGGVYEGIAEYKKALTRYRRALEIAGKTQDNRLLGRALNGIGRVYARLSDYKKALAYFERAATLANQVGDKRGEAQALQNMAYAHDYLGERKKALSYYNRSLEIFQEIGDQRGIADVLNNIGTTYGVQGDYAQARGYFERVLKIREEIEDKSGLERILNNLGLVSKDTGDYKAAINYFQKAIRIAEEIGDKHGAAYSLGNLSGVYYLLAEYEQALDYYRQELKAYQEVGDKDGEARVLMNIGVIYGDLGDNRAELEHYERALAIFQQIGAKDSTENVLTNMGGVYNALGDYQKALDYFQQAFELGRELGYKHGDAFSNLGTVYASLGKFEEARSYLQRALRADQQIGAKRSEGVDLYNLGLVYKKLGRYDEALNFFKRETEIGKQIGDPENIWAGLFGIGQCQDALGRFAEALDSYRAAIEIIESIRGKLVTEEHKIGFVGQKFSIYENIINLLLKLHKKEPEKGYVAQAFSYVERVRARALLELLAEAHIDLRSGIDEKLIERERLILNQISQIQRQLLDVKTSEEKRKALLIDLERLEGEHDEIKREIRRTSPKYSDLSYPQPLNLGEVQSEVIEDGQALLEYFLGEEKSFLWLVRKDRTMVYELPRKAELEKKVKLYLELISERPSSQNMELHYQGGHRLYRELIFPAIGELLQVRNLIIVPDSILYYLPFETLISEAGGTRPRYLVEDYAVSYVPSASILAHIKEEMKERKQQKGKRNELLAFGDPVYPGETSIAQKVSAVERSFAELRISSLSRLPFTAEEVQGISRYFPKDSRKILLREQAREEEAKSAEAEKFKIVHFAVHGFFDEQRPRRSGLILSAIGQGEEDGFLQINEIFNLKLSADLVVLSACQTALGQLTRGEGIVGLARAFMYAGTPSLVASLWNINDKASADFMVAFYSFLKEGESKSQALRNTKLGMAASEKYSHPYYWAPFILVGESTSPIVISKDWLSDVRILTIVVVILFLFAIVITTFYSKRKNLNTRLKI
jgi:CHAT domain-containing protein/Tfp pilus assembly protein PilF